MRFAAFIAVSVLAVAPCEAAAGQTAGTTAGTERYEVKSIKAVRPTLVNTIAALQMQDVRAAKASFDAFDSAWNGIEVYINTRSPELYAAIETDYEARIMMGLDAPTPDVARLLADARAMLAKFDEAVKMVEQAAPLNPLYDDVARLRTVRAHLREVNPALKKDDIAKARKSFDAFSDTWDSIEDLVKVRSREAYDGIEKGMIQIERALMPTKPDVNAVTALVSGVMDQYNTIVGQVVKEARNAK